MFSLGIQVSSTTQHPVSSSQHAIDIYKQLVVKIFSVQTLDWIPLKENNALVSCTYKFIHSLG